MATFDYLVRFEDSTGAVRYGNQASYRPTPEIVGSEVEVLSGDISSGFKKTGEKAKIAKVSLITQTPIPR
jgi:transcription initiation factor TFIIH subunit 2